MEFFSSRLPVKRSIPHLLLFLLSAFDQSRHRFNVAAQTCPAQHTLSLRHACRYPPAMSNYMIAQLDDTPTQRCPCGFTKRAFAGSPDNVASLHIVEIQEDSRTHYHKRMTEIYLVLEGEGQMELDGQLFPVKPMTAIYIRPGCRHRAIGKLKIVNLPVPSFDESDEWFD